MFNSFVCKERVRGKGCSWVARQCLFGSSFKIYICVSTLVHMIYDFIIKTGKNASCYWSRVMNVSLATSKALTRMTLPEICLFPKLKSTDGLGIVGCFYGTVLSFVIGQAIPEIPPPPHALYFPLTKKESIGIDLNGNKLNGRFLYLVQPRY